MNESQENADLPLIPLIRKNLSLEKTLDEIIGDDEEDKQEEKPEEKQEYKLERKNLMTEKKIIEAFDLDEDDEELAEVPFSIKGKLGRLFKEQKKKPTRNAGLL